MRHSAVQWQVSLIRGFGQYFLEVMEGSEDSDWGSVFSIWNLLMILLFGFLTKKIYDCFGGREEGQKTPEAPSGSETTQGSAEKSQGSTEAGSTVAGPTGVEDIQKVDQGKLEASAKDKDGSGKTLGPTGGSSVDGDSKSSSDQKDSGAREGEGAAKETVSLEKQSGLKSAPRDAASGLFGKGSDPVMAKVEEIAGDMKEMSEEERKNLAEQSKDAAELITPQKAQTMATGRDAGNAGFGSKVKGEVMERVEDIAGELKAETDDIEKAWMKEQEEKRKIEEAERKMKEEDERKRKEEEEKKKKEEEERKKKEEEAEKKKKEEAEKKKKEEAEKKRKEEEDAEKKKKEEAEKKRKEEEAEKKRKEEEAERKRKEDEEAEKKRKEEEAEKKRKEEEAEKKKKEEEAEKKRKEEEAEKKKKEEEAEKKRKEEEAEKKRKEEEAEKKRKEEEEAEKKRKEKEAEKKRMEEEEAEKKKKEEEAEKKRKEEEEAEKKRKEEAEKKRKEEEEAEKKRKEEEAEKKRKEEEEAEKKRKEEEAEKKRKEEEKRMENEAEEKKKQKEAEDKLKITEAENAATQEKKAQELGKKVDELFPLDDDRSENGRDVERDYVMVSPPHSPLQQVVAPPLMTAKKEEDKQEVARKQQQVEEVMAVVSKDEHDSVHELVNDLTTKQQKTTDFDKARALFIWLSSKDLKTLTFKNAGGGSDEEKLTGLQTGHTTYAQIYQTLCRNAGIECELIHGYAKGVGYKPGMQFEGDNFRHSWNAVKINGEWKLVDPNWGARHVVGKKEGSPEEEKEASDENTVYQLDEYYFLPEAWELIHSHYPDEPEWQLRKPITKEQFENLVLCKSPFFKHDLRIASHTESVIKVVKETEVKIQCPEEHKGNLVFMFTLSYADSLNVAGDSHQGTPLGNFGMQRMLDNISSVIIRPPTPGEYRLVIHVKDLSKPQRVPGKFYYSEVCEYGILVTEAHTPPRPFPPCAHTTWGPGDSMARYSADLIPEASNVVIPTKNGIAEVRFTLKNKLRFLAKLKSASLGEVDRHVIHRVVDNEAVFSVRPPENGEYGLEIYANNKEQDGSTMHHVFQYLIVARDVKDKVEPFPQLPSTFLGPQSNFNSFGMQISSHKDPLIISDDGSLVLGFKTTLPMKLMSQLICVAGGNQEDVGSYVLQNTTKDSVTFRLELPKSGPYKFTLFGLPADQSGDNVPALYNCLIECRHGNGQATPFPKQFSQWKSSGVLVQPTGAVLGSTSDPAKFDLQIMNARSVAVVIGENWTQLSKQEAGNWTGEVEMAQFKGKQPKCVICANMDDNEATFSTLLEYSIAN